MAGNIVDVPITGREATAADVLRTYLDAVALAEPLQSRIWAAAQLTLTQVRALRRLQREAKPLGQLGAELGLTPPSVTRLVDRLEERGLIERRRGDADRRRVVAAILPAGLRLIDSVPLFKTSPIYQAAEELSGEERTSVVSALDLLTRTVRSIEEEAARAAEGAS